MSNPVRRAWTASFVRQFALHGTRPLCSCALARNALRPVVTLLAWLPVLLSACGDAPVQRNEVNAAIENSAGVVDWDQRVSSLQFPGWSIEFCEGEGPFLCVARGSEQVGSVELLRTAVADHAVIVDVLDRGGSEIEALEAAAADLVAVLSADRRIGLGEGYQLRAEPNAPTAVMGKSGLRLVAEGRLGEQILERIVHYYALQQDTLYLFAATGINGGGLLGEFSTEDLRAFEPLFGEIAAASRVTNRPQ